MWHLPQISRYKLETIKVPAGANLAQMIRILNKGGMATEFGLRIIEGKTVKELYHTLKTTDGVVLKVLTRLQMVIVGQM